MDDADLDFSNPEILDSFLLDIPKESHHHACTHTHTCNPPGPDLSHTHTCFHVHTQILSAPSTDESTEPCEKSSSKKRPFGNREAVRKYREKKKARAASLEDEVAQLRLHNQQLMKKLQNQSALEAEVLRLRCLLVDIRGRIEGEIGSFPYQRPVKGGGEFASNMGQENLMGGAQIMNCNMCCDDDLRCFYPGMQVKAGGENGAVNGQGFGVCDMVNVQCMGNLSSGSEFLNCSRSNAMAGSCPSNANEIKETDA